MRNSVKEIFGIQKSRLWFVLAALLISSLTFAQAQNVLFVKSGVTDGDPITVGGVSGMVYNTCKAAVAASAIGDTVRLLEDIVETTQNISGITENLENCCVMIDRRVLDGQGHSLTAAAYVNEVIYTKGGTIMNIVVNGAEGSYAYRGIYSWGYTGTANMNADLILDRVTLNRVLYTYHCDGDTYQNVSVLIKNSNINGWTSFSPVFKSYTVIDSEFGSSFGYAVFRPYGPVVVSGTSFSAGYQLDPIISPSILLNNCNLAGIPLTSDNIDNILVNLATDQPVPQEDPSSHAVVVDGDYSANGDGELIGGIYGGNLDVLNGMCADGYRGVPIPATDPQQYLVTPVYYIHFNSNGGTGGPMADTYVPRDPGTFTVPACEYTNDTYGFAEWNTQADGNGDSYRTDDNVTLTADLTLYAQWARVWNVTQNRYDNDLPTAIGAASAGDRIVLLSDVALATSQTIDKNITLDLGGHTISGSVDNMINITGGNVTIINGTITNSNNKYAVYDTGTGILTLTDCTISAKMRTVHVSGGTVNATNSTIRSTGVAAINHENGVFNATNCTISCDATTPNNMYTILNYDVLNLTNCTVTGPSMIICCQGASPLVNIDGGVIESRSYATSGIYGSGTIINNTGIVNIYGDAQVIAYYRAIQQSNTYETSGFVNIGGYMDEHGNLVPSGAPTIILKDTSTIASDPNAINVYYDGTVNIFGDATVRTTHSLATAAVGCINGGTVNFTGGTVEGFETGVHTSKLSTPAVINTCHVNISDSAHLETADRDQCVTTVGDHPTEIDIWGGVFSEDVSGEKCRDGYAAFPRGTSPQTYIVAPSYTVYYDANMTPNQRDTVYERQENPTHTVQANAFTNGDFAFLTWNTKADGTGTDIAAGAEMNLTTDTTLYAKWKVVAKIGTTGYGTLASAITAANDGETIMVVADITPSELQNININKSLTITAETPNTYTIADHHLTLSGNTVEVTVSNLNFSGNSYINANNGKVLTIDHVNATVNPQKITGRSAFVVLSTAEHTTGLEFTLTNSNIVNTGGTDYYGASVFGWAFLSSANISNNTFGSADYRCHFVAVKLMNVTDGTEYHFSDNTFYGTTDYYFAAFDLYQNNSRANSYTAWGENNVLDVEGTGPRKAYDIERNGNANAQIVVLDNGTTINGTPITTNDFENEIPVAQFNGYYAVDVEKTTEGKYIGGTYSTDVSGQLCEEGYASFANGTDPETYTIAEAYAVYYTSATSVVSDTVYVKKSSPTHTVLPCGFTNGDFAFLAWNTQADGTGDSYSPDDNITLTADITLHAQWKVVAKIGTTEYGTLASAITAANDGETIMVVADITPSELQNITLNKSLTITAETPNTYTIADHHVKLDGNTVEVTVSNLNFSGNSYINAHNGRSLTVDHVNATVSPDRSALRWQGMFIAMGGSEFQTGLSLTVTNNTIVSTNATGEDCACQGWAFIREATITGNTFGSTEYPYPFTAVKLMNATDDATVTITNNTVYGRQGADSESSYFYAFDLYRNNSRANSYAVTSENNQAFNVGTANNHFYLYRMECNTLNREVGILMVFDNGSQVDGSAVSMEDMFYDSSLGANYQDSTLYGVGVVLNSDNQIVEGTFNVNSRTLVANCAETYMPVENADHTYQVVQVYNIHFEANGANGGSMEDYYVPRSAPAITIDECGYTYTTPDQVFVGWNTQADGHGTTYNPGENLTLTADITLYAQWSDFHYVIYHSNDGNDFRVQQLKPDDHTVVVKEGNIFARPGYYVTAWNSQADGSGDTYAPGSNYPAGINEVSHVYAVWTANSDPSLTQYVPGSHAGFVVAGNGDFTAGQLFAIPAVVAAASSAPGVQQGYVVITDYTADRCEGYAFSEYGFDIAADAPARDTLLTNYDPEVRNFYGYDSITNLAVTAHLTQYVTDTTIYLADYVHPDFGTEYGDQTVTYHSEAFGCDSVVTMRVYRLGSILNDTVVAIPGHSEMEVTMTTLPEILPNDFFEAGGTLTPAQVAPYTDNYPTGATTPVVWVATITDSSATFTNYVTVLEPVCDTMHPVDGSGNTYDVVRLIHNCWLKQNLRTELYADGEPVPHVYHYPGADPVIYGYLYTYDDATGHYPPATRSSTILQGVCPNGWHIPTYDDVTELMAYYDTEDLMSQTNWVNPGNNSSEFTMQPAGYYNPASYAPYQMLHVLAYFWTYSPGSSVYHACEFGSMCGTIELLPSSGEMGYSVRCVKN